MSTKPTAGQLPTWDTNLTNTSAITAGHKTDGFLSGAIPTSGELNTVLAFLYLWIKYLSDGAFSGASTFDNALAVTGQVSSLGGVVSTLAAEATLVSTAQFRDYKGQLRSGFDHLGYPSGQYSQWEEHWRTAGTTAPQGWTFTVTTAGSATLTDPTSTFTQRFNRLLSGNATGNAITCTSEYVGWFDVNTELVMEFTVLTEGVSGALATNYNLGLQSAGNSGTDFAYFGGFGGVANWGAYTVINGVLHGVTTAIAFAANTQYRFRIEIIGTNQNSSGGFQVKHYINGVLVNTATAFALAANKVRPYLKAFSTGGTTADAIQVGRLKFYFNHLVSSDNI